MTAGRHEGAPEPYRARFGPIDVRLPAVATLLVILVVILAIVGGACSRAASPSTRNLTTTCGYL